MTIHILVVEDNAGRTAWIRERLGADVIATFASSAGAAIGVIQRDAEAISGIMLDHDLQERARTQDDLYLSGSNLVEQIVGRVPRQVPVLVHSMNPAGAQAMARRLQAFGFSVTRIPMADLTREHLAIWLEEVRDCRDDE